MLTHLTGAVGKRGLAVAHLVIVVFLVVEGSTLGAVHLYMDSAPNVYGSADWPSWWADTKEDVAAGTFTDMRSGTYPGTHWIDPYDEIVYSTGDLGKRLHWIYWIPGETKSTLSGDFEVKWSIDWVGNNWTYVGGSWALDTGANGWVQPLGWEDYDDGQGNTGVIGSLGFAWSATDNEASPLSTDGNPYNEVDQADIDALRGSVFSAQTFAMGEARIRDDGCSPWEYYEKPAYLIPEPAGVIVWGLLVALGVTVGWWRKRRKVA